MTKNIFGSLLPQVLMIVWAAYELFLGINLGQENRILFSSIAISVFVLITIVTLVKVVKYPNDPTYLKNK